MTVDPSYFNKEYFEDGIVTGKSCYTNYRWIPELTIPMSYRFAQAIDLKEDQSILEIGCSKGYMVKGLRLLGFDAYGIDVSEYAIEHVDAEVRNFCKLTNEDTPVPFKQHFDWVVTKDTLEHVPTEGLHSIMKNYTDRCDKMYHVIPLGETEGKFRIPEYHLDASHIQIHHEDWWVDLFEQYGWKVQSLKYKVKGIKENWADHHETGNGFFTLVK